MPEVMDTQDPETETSAPETTTPVPFEDTAIPETYKDNPNVAKYKNVGELIKGHENVVKLIGAKGVIVPKEDAAPEEKEKFYNSLGRPEKPEGYKLSPVEMHPKIKEAYTPEAEGVFKAEMHKLGLTQAQTDALHKWYFENASKGEAARDAATDKALKDGEAALRQKWGAEYEGKILNAKRVVAKFGGKDALDALGDLGSNPAIVKMMADIAANFSEDQIKGFGDKKSEGAQSAKEKIKAIFADPKHPYFNDGDPRHHESVTEVTKLYQEAYNDAN